MRSVELSARDWAVLDRLQEKGDPLTQARHTLLFFYRRRGAAHSAADFDAVLHSAAQLGLSPAGGDESGLILQGQIHVDPVALAPILEWAQEAAEAAGVEFDGWECAVLRAMQ